MTKKPRATRQPVTASDRDGGRSSVESVIAFAKRFERIEAKLFTLTYAASQLTVRAVSEKDDPVAEARLLQKEALDAAGDVRSLASATRVDELARFYEAVILYFDKDH
jgi:hypothetical protein